MDINEEIEIQDLALTEKERLFCEKYAETSNGTKSAIFAGYLKYSPQEAGQILRREDVQKYIKYLRLRVAEQAGVSAVKNAKALAAIAYDDEGKPRDRIAAVDSLNKMFGFNVPKKVEVTGEGGAPIQVTGMVIQAE